MHCNHTGPTIRIVGTVVPSESAAKRHFDSQKYLVEDYSKGHPYDLLCVRDHEVLHVEVKGTQTDGAEIFLTAGEVDFAKSHNGQMALFVLHSSRVSEENDDYLLSGGEPFVIMPWDVNFGELRPVSFRYSLPNR